MTGVPSLYQFKKTDDGLDLPETKEKKQVITKTDDAIYCRACNHVITTEQERTSINNAHTHTCENPSGFVYTFDCFSSAPGCVVLGRATLEHTWFSGYAWQVTMCEQCTEHLGWYFSRDDSFFALIADKLISH